MKTALIYITTALLLGGCATHTTPPSSFSELGSMPPRASGGGDLAEPTPGDPPAPSAGFKAVPVKGTAGGKAPDSAEAAPGGTVSGLKVSTPLAPDMLRPATNSFTLGPGDSIEIEILGNAGSRAITAVGLDGKLYFNVLPGMDVWGLTLEETRTALERELGKYFSQPQVSLTLRSVGSKYVWVLGRLNRPGIYPLPGSMTLLESLAVAGGTARSASQASSQELGDLRHSFVVRSGQFIPVDFYRLLREGDMAQNIYLQPDDFVYVPSALANEVYLLGAVRSPRSIPYQEPMGLIGAIAGADGPAKLDLLSPNDQGPFMKDAYLSHVAIVRGSLAAPQISIVDCKAILKGRAPDVRLEPGDVIYIPNSPYTTVKRYVNLIVNTFVTTIAANEGIRAAGQTTSVNVAVPVTTTVIPPSK